MGRKWMRRVFPLALPCVFVLATAAFCGVAVTTGAGYKQMVEELGKAYRELGEPLEEMYGGPIGQVLVQIKQGSGADVVISDRGALEAASQGLEFGRIEPLGDTVLVLAWRKGLSLESPKDLEKQEFARVAMPDPKAAIYGRAASAFLKSSGIGEKLGERLAVVSTVPQVFSYLASGEMDAGFVNRVMVLNGGQKLGGWLEIAEGYPPLRMVAAVVQGRETDAGVLSFLEFLKGEKGKEILKRHGIW